MYMCINHGPELSPNPDRHANHGPAHTGPGTAHTNNFNGFEHNGSPESGGGTKKNFESLTWAETQFYTEKIASQEGGRLA